MLDFNNIHQMVKELINGNRRMGMWWNFGWDLAHVDIGTEPVLNFK